MVIFWIMGVKRELNKIVRFMRILKMFVKFVIINITNLLHVNLNMSTLQAA